MTTTHAILANALGRRYGDVAAVKHVSLEVQRGEFFALLGPNGAGKTTTVHMLTTLTSPTSGSASVLGYDVVEEAQQVRYALGMVFQDPALDDRLTARENLQIHAVLYRVPRHARRDRIEEALAWGSLEKVGDRRVRTFSGGMKRRLELARALMHHPGVLFLDEPTLGLDPQGRRHLWERIERLRDEGLTVFMTTHYLHEAEACDRVAIMDAGSIVALGKPADLIRDTEGANDLEDVFLTLTGHALRDEEPSPRALMKEYAQRGGDLTR